MAGEHKAVRTHPGPLRGRSEPTALAIGAVRRALHHGSSALIMVGGAPGIGKTALLGEVRRQAVRMQVRVASGRCEPIGQVSPGAPMIAALRAGRSPLVGAEEYEQLTRLSDQPLLLAERIAAVVECAAADGPVLVSIDDWQWADRVSRFIIRTLLGRLIGLPVVWLLAGRDDEALADLAQSEPGSVDQIQLAPLTSADLAAIAQDRLGHAPDERTLGFLAAAAGNPMLAMRILDDLARAAAPGNRDAVSLRFTAAIAGQLAELTEGARALVSLVAVAGRSVSLREAVYVQPISPGAGSDAVVAEACASGLIRATDDTMATPHDLVRDAILAATPSQQVRALHHRFAGYYFESEGDVLTAAGHARHAASSGDVTSALILVAAAERLAHISPEDAGDLAALAFRTVRPEQPPWLGVGRRCLSVLCRTQRAGEAIDVADLILANIDDKVVAGEVESQAAQALWLSGQLGRLLTRIERVLANGPLSAAVDARLRAAAALANTRLLSGHEAGQSASAALERARASADPEAIAVALHACGEAAHNSARHHLALQNFRELRALTGPLHVADEITALQFLDRYDHAQTLLDTVKADGRNTTTSILPALHCAQMWQDYNLGRSDEADAGARTLLELGRQLGSNGYALDAIIVQTSVALLRGDTPVAATRLSAAERLEDAEDDSRRPALTVMRGWVAACQGDLLAAMKAFQTVASGATKPCNYWPLWPCWIGLFFVIGTAVADPAFTDVVVREAETAAEHNPGVASFEGLALNVRGRSTGDLAMVAQSAHVLARSPRPLLRAFGAESLGHALFAAGDRSAGLTQLDRAWDDYHRIGAHSYRAEVQRAMSDAGARRRTKWATVAARPNSGWAALTDGERRVAALIADGHTNRTAAAELGLSVNTISTHLRVVFSKLGIQSRVQLANALNAEGRLPTKD